MPIKDPNSPRPRVLIVDENDAIRVALRQIVECACDVVGEAAYGSDAVHYCEQLMPDVVLLDISLPDVSGIHVARQIIERRPYTRIVFVSTHTSSTYIEEAFRVGARGYVVKNRAYSELLDSINIAVAGGFHIPNLYRSTALNRLNEPSVATLEVEAQKLVTATEDRASQTFGTREASDFYSQEAGRLLNAFAESVRLLVDLHEQQLRAIISGDIEANRFDLLIHEANERKQDAKYAYLKHLDMHGCQTSDGSKQR